MTLFDVVATLGSIAQTLIPVVVGLEVLYFFWTIGLVILRSGDKEGVEDAKKKLVWGVVAIFVTISIWGIVQLMSTLFGIGIPQGTACPPPQIGRDDVSTCL